MPRITNVHAREILDSRGNPTVECEVKAGRIHVRASVPSGASTGMHEAHELRDHEERYGGKGVLRAVKNCKKIGTHIIGMDCRKQQDIDELMLDMDGTLQKEKLGANTILAISLAVAKAGAAAQDTPLYKHIAQLAGTKRLCLPVPHFNIINGGKHAGNKIAIQEYMIAPTGAKTYAEALRIGSETYHKLKQLLEHNYGKNSINVGDEGGFAPPINNTEEPLKLIRDALFALDYQNNVKLAMDAAAQSFWNGKTYYIDGKDMSAEQLAKHYEHLVDAYNVYSIEDPFHEEAFENYARLLKETNIQIVGDDLTVTNPNRIKQAITLQSCNCLLLKVNQIGTLTEAITAARTAREAGWNIMVSHRSGETTDDFIADLAVGLGCGQIKAGAPCRGERLAKYNRLLRISEHIKRFGP